MQSKGLVMKKKHQPPSRIKYDKAHPTISVRVNQELYQKLKEMKDTSGKTVGDILREAVKVQARSTKQAFTAGCTSSKRTYGVTYKCSVCGGKLWIDTTEEREAAAQYMQEHGWRHVTCQQKQTQP